MAWGFVYVLGNDCMPGIYKIGMTERAPQERLEQLSSATAAPMRFWMAFFAQVRDAGSVERRLHLHFDDCRVNESREFFQSTLVELRNATVALAGSQYVHDVDFEPESYIEQRRLRKQFLIDHFIGQDPDPYRHVGFE